MRIDVLLLCQLASQPANQAVNTASPSGGEGSWFNIEMCYKFWNQHDEILRQFSSRFPSLLLESHNFQKQIQTSVQWTARTAPSPPECHNIRHQSRRVHSNEVSCTQWGLQSERNETNQTEIMARAIKESHYILAAS